MKSKTPLHKGSNTEELLKEALTAELFDTFSGYYRPSECQEALLRAYNDPSLAANWLLSKRSDETDTTIYGPVDQILIY